MSKGINDHLVLVCGPSASGKSASLRNLKNPESVMYLNCEAGKRLPFRTKFKYDLTITNPHQLDQAFAKAEDDPEVKVIIVDTLTFLLDMYVSKFVKPAADGRKAWGDFAEYFRHVMQDLVANSSKIVIFTAHTLTKLNEKEMVMETAVPVAGSLKNNGIEAWFSIVIATTKLTLNDEVKEHDMLKITERERLVGYKHVFQTQITKETVNSRIRGPMGLWDEHETYMDNDIQLVIDRLQEFYD
jgi:hypothetical protein